MPVYASVSDLPVGVERFSLYVPPSVGITLLEAIKSKQPKEVYLNPGSESEALIARAEALGLEPILACSIIEIGERPMPARVNAPAPRCPPTQSTACSISSAGRRW